MSLTNAALERAIVTTGCLLLLIVGAIVITVNDGWPERRIATSARNARNEP